MIKEPCEYLKKVGCIKDICTCNTGPKEKTLEEAAEIDLRNLCYYDERNPDNIIEDDEYSKGNTDKCACDNCFYGRSKLTKQLIWQAEKMYSKQDLIEAFKAGEKHGRWSFSCPNFIEWFQKYKNK